MSCPVLRRERRVRNVTAMNEARKGRAVQPAAWLALAIFSGLNLLNYLDRYVLSAVLGPVQSELHLNDATAGWTASAFMLGYFITAPIFGYLGDRFPRRYLALAGVMAWSAATACTGLAQNFPELFAIRIFVGIGEACFVTIAPSWISDLFAATRRNTALTLFYVAIPFGSAIGFEIGGWFAEQGLWREAFYWTGVPGVVLALTLLTLREPGRGEADGVTLAPGKLPVARVGEIMGLLRDGRYGLLVWGYAAQTFALGAFGLWGPAFLHRVHGFSPGSAAGIFGEILAGTGLVATLSGGLLASALRRRMRTGYAWLMAVSLTASVPVCFAALTVADGGLCLGGLGLAMFLIFLPTGPIASELFEIVPVHLRASGMALCTFIIHLFGDFGSPALVGHVSDALGLQKGVLILPVMLMIGAMLWLLLIRRLRAPLEVTL